MAGDSIVTGSNNVILGAFHGTASLSNSLVLADGGGTVHACWNDNAKGGEFALTTDIPTPSVLSSNNSMCPYQDRA